MWLISAIADCGELLKWLSLGLAGMLLSTSSNSYF
jgi:hypothetical protein